MVHKDHKDYCVYVVEKGRDLFYECFEVKSMMKELGLHTSVARCTGIVNRLVVLSFRLS